MHAADKAARRRAESEGDFSHSLRDARPRVSDLPNPNAAAVAAAAKRRTPWAAGQMGYMAEGGAFDNAAWQRDVDAVKESDARAKAAKKR